MWLDYVKQKEEGKGLENFQWGEGGGRGGGVMDENEAGKTEENQNAKGLALLMNKNFTDYVDKFEKHSDRIISCKIKLHGKTSPQIIQIYAPTCDHDNETLELFYEELEKSYGQESLQPPHSNG